MRPTRLRMLEIRTAAGDLVDAGESLRDVLGIAETNHELATAVAYANAQEGDLGEHLLWTIRSFSALPNETALLTGIPGSQMA